MSRTARCHPPYCSWLISRYSCTFEAPDMQRHTLGCQCPHVACCALSLPYMSRQLWHPSSRSGRRTPDAASCTKTALDEAGFSMTQHSQDACRCPRPTRIVPSDYCALELAASDCGRLRSCTEADRISRTQDQSHDVRKESAHRPSPLSCPRARGCDCLVGMHVDRLHVSIRTLFH